MTGAKTTPGVTVKVFVKQHIVTPVRVSLIQLDVAEYRPPSIRPAPKDAYQTRGQLCCDLAQGERLARPGRAFDQKVIAIIHMEFFERLDQQEVDREPDGAAPVGITAEQAGVGFSRLIAD